MAWFIWSDGDGLNGVQKHLWWHGIQHAYMHGTCGVDMLRCLSSSDGGSHILAHLSFVYINLNLPYVPLVVVVIVP
jgi:hypothetical protein